MKRILITGMSGTGKSATIIELAQRGFRAIDLDTAEWSCWVVADPRDTLTPGEGEDWVWREDRVRELLMSVRSEPLFISGCAENMDSVSDLIDVTILLSAPISTIMERLTSRRGGYGQNEDERRKVSELIATVEPLLRQTATIEIDSQASIAETVEEILCRIEGAQAQSAGS